MLRISKLSDYAILVMVELVRAPGEILSAQVLAERAHIELPTARKVLKTLAGAGLVTSYRGASGGYAAERPAAEISVADVITAFEGPIAMTECSVHEGLCSVEAECNARGHWRRISAAVAGALDNITLAEMAGDVRLPEQTIAGLRIQTLNA